MDALLLTILFLICAVVLLSIIYMLWRYWDNVAQVTPEEEAYDKRVASLNERQANRMSDKQLIRQLSEDDAWSIMIARGRRAAARRNRYAGDLKRRTRERRRSSGRNV